MAKTYTGAWFSSVRRPTQDFRRLLLEFAGRAHAGDTDLSSIAADKVQREQRAVSCASREKSPFGSR
jgi:hypothetical protein